jgi:hypothetical protein
MSASASPTREREEKEREGERERRERVDMRSLAQAKKMVVAWLRIHSASLAVLFHDGVIDRGLDLS